MSQITLTPEQAKLFHQSKGPIAICDTDGKVIGTLPPDYSAEFIAELKRRAKSPGRRFSSEQVTRHMQGLAEAWNKEGPFDESRLMEILEQLRSEDAK